MNFHTNKEHILHNSLQIYQFERQFLDHPDSFLEISDELETIIHIHGVGEFDWKFGNKYGLEFIRSSDGNLPKFSEIKRISNVNVMENAVDSIKNFSNRMDSDEILNYFQLFEFGNKKQWLISTKKFHKDSNFLSISYEIEKIPLAGDYIKKILDNTFDDIHAWQKFQSLTKREKQILKMVASGDTTKHISECLSITEATVRKHRENINLKIDAKNIFDIIRFADGFGLIGEL
jgi:DNA-binding CsgD family transcriptional regulator